MKYYFLGLFLLGSFSVMADSDLEKTINVSGVCEKRIMPDRVKVNVTVETLNKSQKVSTEQANSKYNKLLKIYKDLKLDDAEYETTEYRVFPLRPWENRKQVFKGYKTRIKLSISTSEIDKVGKLVNAGNEIGKDFLSGPDQYVSDNLRKKVFKDCLAVAIKDAKDKASIIANASGIKLGKVISVSESGLRPPSPRPMYKAAMTSETLSSPAPNIQIKSSKLSLKLNVFFAIN